MKPIIVSDFDGTITQEDVTDLVLSQLAHPSWREVEQEWALGLIGSRECLERQVALVDASAKELNALIDSVSVDPYFANFHDFARRKKIPLYVVSDGFDLIIRRVMKHSGLNGPLHHGKHLFSSRLKLRGRRLEPRFPYSGPPCAHNCATCKVEVIRRLRGKGSFVVFIGDGLSDQFAAREADVVFAKRQLLAHCRNNGIPCWPFETFEDLQAGFGTILESTLDEVAAARRESKVRNHPSKVAVAIS